MECEDMHEKVTEILGEIAKIRTKLQGEKLRQQELAHNAIPVNDWLKVYEYSEAAYHRTMMVEEMNLILRRYKWPELDNAIDKPVKPKRKK